MMLGGPTRTERECYHGVRIGKPNMSSATVYKADGLQGKRMWRSQEASSASAVELNLSLTMLNLSASALACPFGHLRLCLKLGVQGLRLGKKWVQTKNRMYPLLQFTLLGTRQPRACLRNKKNNFQQELVMFVPCLQPSPISQLPCKFPSRQWGLCASDSDVACSQELVRPHWATVRAQKLHVTGQMAADRGCFQSTSLPVGLLDQRVHDWIITCTHPRRPAPMKNSPCDENIPCVLRSFHFPAALTWPLCDAFFVCN